MSTAVKPAADITITTPTVAYEGGAVMTPMAMIAGALEKGATPETLEKLLALQERWEAGQAKKAFDVAIGAAKAQIPTIIKDKGASFEGKGGNTTSYRYETMPALAKVLEPILHAQGLSYRYTSEVVNGQIAVTCIVSHVGGHKEGTTLQCPPDTTGSKNAVQAIGSAVTYLQRYTLKLALGISASDDDDANKVSDMDTINADQFRELTALIEKAEADERKIIDYVGGNDLESLSVAQFKKAMGALNDFMRNKGRRK